MRTFDPVLVLLLACLSVRAGEVSFSARPVVKKTKDGATIAFAVSSPTDVEVAVLGQDDKVVRHLAAGALGVTNAPPEPLKPGLAQDMTWDGKDDLGKPAVGEPWRVRVRAGLRVKFGRTVADGDCNFLYGSCRGLAVDTNGDLYYMGKLAGASRLSYFLRVYDREGKYLREILPYPSTVPADGHKPFGSLYLAGEDRWVPRSYSLLWPMFIPDLNRNNFRGRLVGLSPKDGSVALLDWAGLGGIRKQDGAVTGPTFARPIEWVGKKTKRSPTCGSVAAAYSPDGAWLYITDLADPDPKNDWPDGCVYRLSVETGQCEPFIRVALPGGKPFAKGAWDPTDSRTALHGIRVDHQGRIMVCDAANGKVRLFSPDGKETASADVPHAYEAAVEPKTGTLYVLTRREVGNCVFERSLLKLQALKEGAAATDTMAFGAVPHGPCALAADFSGPAPQLWVAGARDGSSLLRIRDEGGKLAVVEDLADRDKLSCGTATRLAVDREADRIYISDGTYSVYAYDGLSGRYAGKTTAQGRPDPIDASELCVRRDGVVYAGGAPRDYSGSFRLLDRDLKPLPVPTGGLGYYYGRQGGGYYGNHGCAVWPDGSLLVCNMHDWCAYSVFEIGADGKGIAGPRLKGFFTANKHPKAVSSRNYEKIGIDSALIGPISIQCGGVVAGPGRHPYLGMGILPRDYKLPDELDKVETYRGMWGSVIKFNPTGGAVWPDDGRNGKEWLPKARPWFPALTIPEKFPDGLPMGPITGLRNTFVEGAIRVFPGLATFSGGGGGCVCQTPRFDVDDFGRVYIPNALTCSVSIWDDSGNLITRFGSYGNHDSQGPGEGSPIKTPEIPLAYPCSAQVSYKHIYVADSANRRVIRADPAYAVEDVCPIK